MTAAQKVLVTGASGFIGTHLCKKLKVMGADIHAISRAKHLSGQDDMKWWQSDLHQEAEVHDLVKLIQPDVVYHLSSCVTGSRKPEIILPTFYSNLLSTVNLLLALRDVNCERVVLVGSMEEPTSIEAGFNSISPYAIS
ncbi:MAG: NAD-dependent epimerase/dehydratase family protein, partial [Methanosarcinaceae archaeon]|nr:NAD-dependent epimerase/dehydratase family protein [Methanosarcinaceae archaeon]